MDKKVWDFAHTHIFHLIQSHGLLLSLFHIHTGKMTLDKNTRLSVRFFSLFGATPRFQWKHRAVREGEEKWTTNFNNSLAGKVQASRETMDKGERSDFLFRVQVPPRVGEERRQGERLRKKNGNELCECSSFSAFKRISVWKMGKITIVKTQESV